MPRVQVSNQKVTNGKKTKKKERTLQGRRRGRSCIDFYIDLNNSWLWLLIFMKLIEPTWTFAIFFTKMNPNLNPAPSFFVLITLVLYVSAAHSVRKLATLGSPEVYHMVYWQHVLYVLFVGCEKEVVFWLKLKGCFVTWLIFVVSLVCDCRFLSHQTFHRRRHQVMAGLMRTSVSVDATTAGTWLVAFNSHQLVS